jgi:hypothetical protein
MQYLLFLHRNNCCAKAPQFYLMPVLPLLYDLFRDVSAAGLIVRADSIICEGIVRFDVLDRVVKDMAPCAW